MSPDDVQTVRHAARPFHASSDALALGEIIGDARYVLIGESTHGTHEFYRTRADLTRLLIERHGFTIVALEADWPDAARVNRWVQGGGDDPDGTSALGNFTRFPRWMWRNADVVAFVEWLRAFNAGRPPDARAGVYGLDLYSLHASMASVLEYLRRVDPAAAQRARDRYGCLDAFTEDAQGYGYAASLGLTRSCEDEVVAQLVELRRRAAAYAALDGRRAMDEYFSAEQNARLVRSAEEYYRAMFGGRVESWNLRDTHMMDTLDAIVAHIRGLSGDARAVVWAHNSHLGDARATEMATIGELNLGQLVRERHPGESCLIGMTTHTGTVTAASNWDDPAERKRVRPSLPGSCERLFHDTGIERFALALGEPEARAALSAPCLQRAIGVIYRPDTERASHYLHVRLPDQFDWVLHIDRTHALEPIERWAVDETDLPDTYPSAL